MNKYHKKLAGNYAKIQGGNRAERRYILILRPDGGERRDRKRKDADGMEGETRLFAAFLTPLQKRGEMSTPEKRKKSYLLQSHMLHAAVHEDKKKYAKH